MRGGNFAVHSTACHQKDVEHDTTFEGLKEDGDAEGDAGEEEGGDAGETEEETDVDDVLHDFDG